jgi:hypothetical protein
MYNTRSVTKANAAKAEAKTPDTSPVTTGQVLTFMQPNIQRSGSPHGWDNILHLHEQRIKAAVASPK